MIFIESNSESKSKLNLVLGLGITQDPDPINSFSGGMSGQDRNSVSLPSNVEPMFTSSLVTIYIGMVGLPRSLVACPILSTIGHTGRIQRVIKLIGVRRAHLANGAALVEAIGHDVLHNYWLHTSIAAKGYLWYEERAYDVGPFAIVSSLDRAISCRTQLTAHLVGA